MEKVETICYLGSHDYTDYGHGCYAIKDWSEDLVGRLVIDYVYEDLFIVGRIVNRFRYKPIGNSLSSTPGYYYNCDPDFNVTYTISDSCYFATLEEVTSELL